jgi:hypothetical protein
MPFGGSSLRPPVLREEYVAWATGCQRWPTGKGGGTGTDSSCADPLLAGEASILRCAGRLLAGGTPSPPGADAIPPRQTVIACCAGPIPAGESSNPAGATRSFRNSSSTLPARM